MSARVLLGDTLVGELRPNPERGETSFEFDAGYAMSATRPVLGRCFEDRLVEPPREFRGAPLPNFFRNLLPEGALRTIIEKRLGSTELLEYTMLLRLGGNLPGAVRVVSDELDMSSLDEGEQSARRVRDPFRFALTGVQPKLSLSRDHDKLTVPMEGEEGGWIAKFGSPAFRSLVENECAMLDWAGACGLPVPDHRVIRAREIENLPEDFDPEQSVLVVRRFDRGERGSRIHQEDFAQVFDIPPEEKYPWEVPDLGWLHYGSIGAVIYALCGPEDHRDYMKRLVFMVLSGNADAHIKNWALVYPDGLRAQISPVYDFVSTVVYPSLGSHSALRWSEPERPSLEPDKALADVTADDLLLAASYSSADTSVIMDDIAEFAQTMRTTWPTVSGGAPAVVREAVTAHLQSAKLR